MMHSGLNQRQQNETHIYHFLGVKYFCKGILWFEKIKNHKTDKKNENYHLSAIDIISLEKHKGFLLYNALLHSVSIFFIIVYCVLASIARLNNPVMDIIMTILLLLNIYCIILQRTNYLRIKKCFGRYYKYLYDRLSYFDTEIVKRIYINDPSILISDYKVICKLKNAFDGKSDYYIGIADIDNLKRIHKCAEALKQRKNNRQIDAISENSLLEQCNSIKGPYTLLQRQVDYLQRKFRVVGRKMLDKTAIITENAECEMLYKKIVPEDTVSNYCHVFVLLHVLFSNEVKKVKSNEM